MKKIATLLFALPIAVFAQKEIKPSVSKAESALQKGNFDEAKAIIDATVSNQEYMVDKKGNPSRNAAKAWYLKGMIYAGIDTTKVEKYKSLEADPFPIAKEAFLKAEELDKGKKNESLVNRLFQNLPIPMTKDEVNKFLAQAYLERGYKIYQAKDYKKAFVDIERVLFFVPTDTTQLLNAGVYFGPAADETEKSIAYIKKYQAAGGKNVDAFIQLYALYAKKADAERAKYKGKGRDEYLKDTAYVRNINLALGVAKQLTEKYPTNMDYLNMEYNIYTQTNRLPEAKALMEKKANADANDKESRYFLGLIDNELKDYEGAKKWMQEALKIDADYFDANMVLAKLTYADAQKVKDQRNAINGSKDADLKKRQELYLLIPKKLKESLPYWEKCAAINSADQDAMYGLLNVYSDLTTYDETYEAKIKDLKKKMKAQGMEVD
ncbi:MAG: hypothetical protein JSS79_17550 [Bacteroidetes bacterium]|nr:hypothetical protein [Bacteroidota bacterium]